MTTIQDCSLSYRKLGYSVRNEPSTYQ